MKSPVLLRAAVMHQKERQTKKTETRKNTLGQNVGEDGAVAHVVSVTARFAGDANGQSHCQQAKQVVNLINRVQGYRRGVLEGVVNVGCPQPWLRGVPGSFS